MFDHLIKGGMIVDGTGAVRRTGDVAVTDGKIVEVGDRIDGSAHEVIDADGALVTPGWVDVHTHYDGQVSWDTEIAPSSHNGVTTIVMGNCGVGFAPVPPGQEQELIELMEGVEDIPGSALHEGMEWGRWETFPEYLDYLGTRQFSLDVSAQIAHGAVRYYVMGERGRVNEDATAADMAEMARLVGEAIAAGAVGFSTSRTIGHRALWGEPVPGTFAPEEELLAIADAMKSVGKGVFEMIPSGTVGKMEALGGEKFSPLEEMDIMKAFAFASGRPVTFTMTQSPDYDPEMWREMLRVTEEVNAAGGQLRPQVASRPIGFISGLGGYHAFMRKPTYLEHLAHLSTEKRAEAMRRPEVREKLMSETDVEVDAPGSMENLYGPFQMAAPAFYPLSNPVDYEPTMDMTLGARAMADGVDPLDYLYDFLCEGDGSNFAALSAPDIRAHLDVLREMLIHPDTVTGLSDAGAHVTLICDGTMPTTQISYWARDRQAGEKIPLELIVAKQTGRNAALYGFDDRGTLEVGRRADINVIDFDNLSVAAPVAHDDLPAGGTRLMQPVRGYLATMCNGVIARRNDEDTGARPGRLLRS